MSDLTKENIKEFVISLAKQLTRIDEQSIQVIETIHTVIRNQVDYTTYVENLLMPKVMDVYGKQ